MINRRVLLPGMMALAGCATRSSGPRTDLINRFSSGANDVFSKPPPFLVTFDRNRLGMIAANHSTESDDPQFQAIREGFRIVRPEIVIVEGVHTNRGENPPNLIERARKQASSSNLYSAGETLFSINLALSAGAQFIGGEASDGEIFSDLTALGIDPRDAFYAFMFGPFDQDFREGKTAGPTDPRFDERFGFWAEIVARQIPEAPDTSVSAFRAWYRERFGIDVNEDPDWLNSNDPARDGPMREVIIAHTFARDRHLFGLITDRMTSGTRTLVVFGASHVADLWKATEATYGRPTVY